MEKKWEHCSEIFDANRKNQKYWSNSCRTISCYKRNDYNYKSGGYKKNIIDEKPAELKGLFPIPSGRKITVKVEEISVAGIGNSTAGNIIVESLIAGGKRILFLEKVNATKKDINELKLIISQQNKTI